MTLRLDTMVLPRILWCYYTCSDFTRVSLCIDLMWKTPSATWTSAGRLYRRISAIFGEAFVDLTRKACINNHQPLTSSCIEKKTAAWWWIEDSFFSNKALITWENLQLHLIPMNHMVEQVGRRSHPMNSWSVPWLVPMGPMARRSWSFHNRRVSKISWWVNPDHSIVVHRFSRNVWV